MSEGSAEKNSAKSDATSSTPRNFQNSEESSVQTDNINYDRSGSTDSSPGIAEILSDPNVCHHLLAVAQQTSSDGSIDFSKIRNIKMEEEEPMEGDISTPKHRTILNKDELRDSLCSPSSKKKEVTVLTVDTKSSVVQKLKFSDLSPHMSRSMNTTIKDNQYLKSLAPAKKISIEKANAFLKCNKSTKHVTPLMTQMDKCQVALVDTDSDSFFQLVACQTPNLAPLDPNEKETILCEKTVPYMSSNKENFVMVSQLLILLPLWNQVQMNCCHSGTKYRSTKDDSE